MTASPTRPCKPVWDALRDVVDAAGGLDYSRVALQGTIRIAQQEWEELIAKSGLDPVENWTGVSTQPVYYAFYAAATWTRTVENRYRDCLLEAVRPPSKDLLNEDLREILKDLREIRRKAATEFNDARNLADCYLHRYTPPYPNFSARVEGSTVIYPVVDKIIDKKNFWANLRFDSGRDAATVVDQYWVVVSDFIDNLLDVFYPPPPAAGGVGRHEVGLNG